MENNAEEENQNQNVEQQQQQEEGGNEGDLPEDPRLNLLNPEWLEGLDCLHIGCNDGTLTIQIAKRFRCWKILGIDRFSSHITEAKLNLSRVVEPISLTVNYECGSYRINPSQIISFRKEIIKRNELLLMDNMYDIILCLSTTHLIELNLEGHNLVTFFRRLWYSLKPKGRLVLDPKSLRPYGSNFYDSEAETKAMRLNPNETIISRMVNILTEEFWRELVDERYYRRIYQINSNGECLVIFKK